MTPSLSAVSSRRQCLVSTVVSTPVRQDQVGWTDVVEHSRLRRAHQDTRRLAGAGRYREDGHSAAHNVAHLRTGRDRQVEEVVTQPRRYAGPCGQLAAPGFFGHIEYQWPVGGQQLHGPSVLEVHDHVVIAVRLRPGHQHELAVPTLYDHIWNYRSNTIGNTDDRDRPTCSPTRPAPSSRWDLFRARCRPIGSARWRVRSAGLLGTLQVLLGGLGCCTSLLYVRLPGGRT